MADTVRTKAQLLTLFADNSIGAITPQNARDFILTTMNYLDGNVPAWGASTSGSADTGGTGRMRLSRASYSFAGASYNDPTRAGMLLQIGDNPESSDGVGGYIGQNNAIVFLSMQGETSQIGADQHVMFEIAGRNSSVLPQVFGLHVYMSEPHADHSFAAEFDLVNTSSDGYGTAVIVSGGGAGTKYANNAIEIAAQGNKANWATGIAIDAVISTGKGIYISDAIPNTHAGMAYGIDLTGVTGGFTAAIYIPNAQKLAWKGSGGSLDAFIWEDSSNNLVFRAGAANQIWFEDQAAARLPLKVNTAALTTGSGTVAYTALLINYDKGTLVTGAQVYVGAADSGGTGYRNLMVPN